MWLTYMGEVCTLVLFILFCVPQGGAKVSDDLCEFCTLIVKFVQSYVDKNSTEVYTHVVFAARVTYNV